MKILALIIAVIIAAYAAGRFYSHELITKTNISADSAEVWKHLSSFNQYEQWNPFVISAQGEAIEGAQIQVTIQPPGGKPTNFQPTLLVVEEEREIRWLGHFLIPGLFDGEHYFEISPTTDGNIALVQGERFSGLMAWLLMPLIEADTKAGFESMNAALKLLAES
jgi:hypothetical protein